MVLPVEWRSPFCCSVARSALRPPHVWRLSGGLLPRPAVNKKQQTLQHLLTLCKTQQTERFRCSSPTVAPEVRGHSPRCCCSFGFSLAHPPDWLRGFSRWRCSSVGFSQSWLVGELAESVCQSVFLVLLLLQSWMEIVSSPGPLAQQRIRERGVSFTGHFALRYADGGCPSLT